MHEPDGDADPNPHFGLRGCKATGWRMVDQLDGADLDHAMAAQRIKASCLGIDDDLTHKKSSSCVSYFTETIAAQPYTMFIV